MHSLDRHLASNVCCRKENSFQDRHCIGRDALANNSNSRSTKSDIAQKLKQGNIFWKNSNENTSKQALLQPGNRKCSIYVPNQNSGEGRGSLRPGDLGAGAVDHHPDQTGG